MSLYQFPIAAVSNDHKHRGLTTQIYSFTDLEVRNLSQSVGSIVLLLEASEENLFPCVFQLTAATCAPWLMALSSTFRASLQSQLLLSHLMLLPFTFLPPSYEKPCEYTGPPK